MKLLCISPTLFYLFIYLFLFDFYLFVVLCQRKRASECLVRVVGFGILIGREAGAF